WTPNGPTPLSWDIYAVPTGGAAPTAASTPTANTLTFPYQITGLDPDTEYTFWVRANCSVSETSEWSTATGTFLTLPTCPKPTLLSVVGIPDMTEVTIQWTAGGSETQWEIIHVPAGSPAPAVDDPSWQQADTNPFTVTDLTSGTNYDIYVRAICAADDISTLAGPLTFNTSICPAADQCLYTFTMTDLFGDGWNGNTMSVIQNGVTVATIGSTFTNGSTATVQIPLCNGVAFELFWNTTGFFATEVGVSITSFLGETIFTHPTGSNLQGTT